MNLRTQLPLTATIPSGTTVRLIARSRSAFRPERLLVSPLSFPLSLARRAWTWPLVAIGSVLVRAHRGLAKLLRVELHATLARPEYVSAEYARAHPEEVSWDGEEVSWDGDEDSAEGRPFVLVSTPLSRRERLLVSLSRAAERLSQVRLWWQLTQLSTVLVRDVAISRRPPLVDSAPPLPADMFAAPAIGSFVSFSALSCRPGDEIEIEVHNGNRRECRLAMTVDGSAEPEPERR